MEYCNKQAREIAALLVKATLVPKEREMAAVGLLMESLNERFGSQEPEFGDGPWAEGWDERSATGPEVEAVG